MRVHVGRFGRDRARNLICRDAMAIRKVGARIREVLVRAFGEGGWRRSSDAAHRDSTTSVSPEPVPSPAFGGESVASIIEPPLGPDDRVSLEAALRDPSADVAIAALDALAERGALASMDAFLAILNNPAGYFASATRIHAVKIVTRVLGREAFDPLVRLIDDADAEVSGVAISSLAELGDPRAEASLRRVLAQPNYYLLNNRLLSLEAMARLGVAESELRGLADADPDPTVRAFVFGHARTNGGPPSRS